MGDLLGWLSDHLPNGSVWFIVICEVVVGTGLASPAVAAFAGAAMRGVRGGWAGLVLGYGWGNYAILSTFSLMTRCKPEQHCSGPPMSWVEIVVYDAKLAVEGFLLIWPWQCLWIGLLLACLWAGLALRRRRLRVVA